MGANMNNKVYIVCFAACDANDGVLGDAIDEQLDSVFAIHENAIKRFNALVEEEREHAIAHEYEIYEDSETVFDAGIDGDYIENHTIVKLLERTLSD